MEFYDLKTFYELRIENKLVAILKSKNLSLKKENIVFKGKKTKNIKEFLKNKFRDLLFIYTCCFILINIFVYIFLGLNYFISSVFITSIFYFKFIIVDHFYNKYINKHLFAIEGMSLSKVRVVIFFINGKKMKIFLPDNLAKNIKTYTFLYNINGKKFVSNIDKILEYDNKIIYIMSDKLNFKKLEVKKINKLKFEKLSEKHGFVHKFN